MTTETSDAAASVETAYNVAVGNSFEGKVADAADEDWVAVELVAGQSYDIRLQRADPDGIGDPVLSLYDSAGALVVTNDDIDTYALEVESMLEFVPETSGIYYVSASGYPDNTDEETGRYRLTVAVEADDNPDTPWELPVGGRFIGTLDTKFDEDWIRVELVAGRTYEIALAGAGPDTDTDTILRVYDAAGEQVAFHDDVDYAAGKVNSQLIFTPDTTGTYYIGAGAYRGNPTQDNSGRYQVTVYDTADVGLIVTGTEGVDAYESGLAGGPGGDVLDGQAGDDFLEGGPGGDTLNGGEGDDTALYLYSDAGVEINLYDGTAAGGHAEGDVLIGIEYLIGSAYDDTLVGDAGANALWGYLGDDVLDGQDGHDWLVGDAGADRLHGGAGSDWASYSVSDAGVMVNLYDGTASGGHAEGDLLFDIERLDGSVFDDVLTGDDREQPAGRRGRA